MVEPEATPPPRPPSQPPSQPPPQPVVRHVAATHPAAQTPMMRQYLQAKADHPDAIVLFRMGDFYETFFDDAEEVSRLLELTLTSRNKADAAPIPMAGVPHHALWSYVPRLLEAGRRVAICEQMEDPRVAKGIVKREVVRVITPGLVVDDEALDSRRNNWLAALVRGDAGGGPGTSIGLAWLDASTGERRGAEVEGVDRAIEELGRIEPAEVLVPAGDEALADLVRSRVEKAVVNPVEVPPAREAGRIEAADLLLDAYLGRTRLTGSLALKPREDQDLDGAVRLGRETVRNLELLRTLSEGRRKGSVLGLLDHTRTAMGGRRLRDWLLHPLTDPRAIDRRLDAVEALVGDPELRAGLRDSLAGVHDLERLVTRTVAGNATPRDVAALAASLERVPELARRLEGSGAAALSDRARQLDAVPEAVALVRAALVDDPPPTLKDGGVVREGHDDALDELIAIARDGKSWFQRYAETLRKESGIPSLKIRYNGVFGYFIEVTKANLEHVPDTWLRKQTLANAERYYTPDLKEREEKVLGAHDRRVALEEALFETLRHDLARLGARIQSTAEGLAELDVLAGLAELAHRRGYVRPIVDRSLRIEIEEGRHPVVETLVPAGGFVPNDVVLDSEGAQLLVITGPNMAGKSTVMRQVALLVLLAQMGSFVPAARARIGVVDEVFTRVGASDDLARGQSTFMVEMTEAAAILRRATRRSLVVLDEIGRGTSTYDGVSIAWAVAEDLHDRIGCRTLFATHYHELQDLARTRERIVNMTIAVKPWKEDIVFLRRLVPGGTSHSYGIQVARLAGLPEAVVERSKVVLRDLEKTRMAEGRGRQLELFAPAPPPSPVESLLGEIDPDSLTPRAAHELLYELCARSRAARTDVR